MISTDNGLLSQLEMLRAIDGEVWPWMCAVALKPDKSFVIDLVNKTQITIDKEGGVLCNPPQPVNKAMREVKREQKMPCKYVYVTLFEEPQDTGFYFDLLKLRDGFPHVYFKQLTFGDVKELWMARLVGPEFAPKAAGHLARHFNRQLKSKRFLARNGTVTTVRRERWRIIASSNFCFQRAAAALMRGEKAHLCLDTGY